VAGEVRRLDEQETLAVRGYCGSGTTNANST
jgi:hypothetical protein